MRVLFLNLYYPPDTSATAKVAESMVHALSSTHEITVLCGRPSYDPTERRAWKFWQTERISTSSPSARASSNEPSRDSAATSVIRVGSTDYSRMQMKRRVLNYLSYVALAIPRALFVPCDVVLAMTDPPFEGIVGAFIAMLKRKPLAYIIQDMYPDMAVAGSIFPPGLMARSWERLHRWALRRATRIIVLGDDMRARIISKGIEPAKIFIVRNGVNITVAGLRTPLNPEVIRDIRGNFHFVLLHAGNLGFYGAWDTIIAAARTLQNDGIGFIFVGDGAERSRLEIIASGLTNVRFLPFYPSRDIPSVLAAPDAHLVTIKRGLEGVVVPSKMFGILAAGKPIVAVAPAETDVAALGIRQGFAVCADPATPDELVSAIRLLAANPARMKTMGEAASAAAPEYSRTGELEKLEFIITSL